MSNNRASKNRALVDQQLAEATEVAVAEVRSARLQACARMIADSLERSMMAELDEEDSPSYTPTTPPYSPQPAPEEAAPAPMQFPSYGELCNERDAATAAVVNLKIERDDARALAGQPPAYVVKKEEVANPNGYWEIEQEVKSLKKEVAALMKERDHWLDEVKQLRYENRMYVEVDVMRQIKKRKLDGSVKEEKKEE